jgi:hypothetical protein
VIAGGSEYTLESYISLYHWGADSFAWPKDIPPVLKVSSWVATNRNITVPTVEEKGFAQVSCLQIRHFSEESISWHAKQTSNDPQTKAPNKVRLNLTN